MAFNPFHGFRKHQRTIITGIVIVCMLVFILQFGAGDIFSRALNWFGASRGKGQHVTTLNGSKVYESDLGTLARQRQAANGFLSYAAEVGSQSRSAEERNNPLAMQASMFQMRVRFWPQF